MPLYEYTCSQCSHQFDQLRPIAEADSAAACPTCDSHDTSRSISAIASPKIGMDSPQMEANNTACACGGGCACGRH